MAQLSETIEEQKRGLLKSASILSFKCVDIINAIRAEDWRVVAGLVADIGLANGHLQRAQGRFVGADLLYRRIKKDDESE